MNAILSTPTITDVIGLFVISFILQLIVCGICGGICGRTYKYLLLTSELYKKIKTPSDDGDDDKKSIDTALEEPSPDED